MKKLISFSLFAMIVLFALIGGNTASAQSVTQRDYQSQVMVRPGCRGSHRVRVSPRLVVRPHYRRHFVHGARFYTRPVRTGRYGW